MSTNSTAKVNHPIASARTAQTHARIAGVLILISIVAGIFGEVYVPSKLIVASDATATARNIASFALLFRMGFASYLVEAVCDVTLVLIFYVLLKPVQKNISLLAAFFGLTATATYAFAEIFYFVAPLVLGGADYLKAFSPDQLHAFALLSLNIYSYGALVFMVFYGAAWVLRGYLVFRSGYLPRALGALMVLAGCGFIANNFIVVLAPPYATKLLLLPMFLAAISLVAWLLVKGINVSKWEVKVGELNAYQRRRRRQ